jgi:hypothetical protein
MFVNHDYKHTIDLLTEKPNAWFYSPDGETVKIAEGFWDKLQVCVRYFFKPSVYGSKLDEAMARFFPEKIRQIILSTLEEKKLIENYPLHKRQLHSITFDQYSLGAIKKQTPALFENLNAIDESINLDKFNPDPKLLKRFAVFEIASWIDTIARQPPPPPGHWRYKEPVKNSMEIL